MIGRLHKDGDDDDDDDDDDEEEEEEEEKNSSGLGFRHDCAAIINSMGISISSAWLLIKEVTQSLCLRHIAENLWSLAASVAPLVAAFTYSSTA